MTSQMVNLDKEKFWQYSVTRYAKGDVAPLSLLLQDQHGVNVNVLLLVCWCLENNAVINLMQLKSVIDAAANSDVQLKLHREKRKAARPVSKGSNLSQTSTNTSQSGGEHNSEDGAGKSTGKSTANYEALKEQELELEKKQQEAIVKAFCQLDVHRISAPPSGDKSKVLNASVAALINAYGLRENQEARSLVSQLIAQLP